ncbi:MAG: hypothetical protein JSW64_07840 [Candidatus Zixiibacteriota bacterium]|nr:MAG: hypothetical protein JSW64_07840 [candidate division Zixibacteria bacterium]
MANPSNSSYIKAIKKLLDNRIDIEAFAKSQKGLELKNSFTKIICWCKGLSYQYSTNEARIFLAGAWSEVVNILALVPLHFYRQSIISMRIILDQILAWSYYESHPVEFNTSKNNPEYWVGKEKIYEFLRIHFWSGKIEYIKLGIWSEINRLYSELSYFIHASSIAHMSLVESFESYKKDDQKIDEVIRLAKKTDEAVAAFLSSIYQDAFCQFTPELQNAILKYWNKNKIRNLGLSP